MSISQQSKLILAMKSGGQCGICKKSLLFSTGKDDKPLGECAHIQGDKPGSARYNEGLSDDEKNSHENLFFLCPTCHTMIDKNATDYPVERLLAMKAVHEAKIAELLKQSTVTLDFYELEATLRHLESTPSASDSDLVVVPPKDKISKNGLSSNVENYLRSGLMQNGQVEDFLNKSPDMDYANKIRSYFIDKYLELRTLGLQGDDMFYKLWNIAVGNGSGAKRYAAALSIVSYYFYLCEVFER